MQAYLKRTQLKSHLKELLQNYPATALLGARQVGKSTLAKKILNEEFKKSLYLDLQLPEDRNKILGDPSAFLRYHQDRLICLDEIQYAPDLFGVLRGIIDQKRTNSRFLILGSASRHLVRQSSETLAGRIAFLHISPFNLNEVRKAKFQTHWLRGGYPLSFLAKNDTLSWQWRKNYIRTFLERDIPHLGFNIPAATLERFWNISAWSQGKTLNSSKIGSALGKSSHTVKSYIDILESTFILRTLKPYTRNIKKRMVKSSKTYIRDTGLLHALLGIESMDELFGHSIYGNSFETYVIENIACAFPERNLYFYRSRGGAELDLIVEKAGKLIAIEIKASRAPKLSRGFWHAAEDIKADQRFLIAPVDNSYPFKDGVTVTNVSSFIHQLKKQQN